MGVWCPEGFFELLWLLLYFCGLLPWVEEEEDAALLRGCLAREEEAEEEEAAKAASAAAWSSSGGIGTHLVFSPVESGFVSFDPRKKKEKKSPPFLGGVTGCEAPLTELRPLVRIPSVSAPITRSTPLVTRDVPTAGHISSGSWGWDVVVGGGRAGTCTTKGSRFSLMGIFVVVFELVVVVETDCAGLDDDEEEVVVVGVDVAPRAAAAIFSSLRFQTLTVGFACAATIFSALTASICPCIFSAPSNGGDGDDERVVASVTDEFGVPSALVDTDDTAADETAVLAVDTTGLASTSTGGADADAAADGRWWGTTGGGGGAAMGDRMFCAFRARSAYESGFEGIWTVGDAIPVLVRAFWVKGLVDGTNQRFCVVPTPISFRHVLTKGPVCNGHYTEHYIRIWNTCCRWRSVNRLRHYSVNNSTKAPGFNSTTPLVIHPLDARLLSNK